MSKSSIYKFLSILVVGSVGLWAGLQFGQTTTLAPSEITEVKSDTGNAQVSFSLPGLDGKGKIGPETWAGKVVLINFWATWCAPCREEIPLFIEFQNKYQDKGFQVVGIALDREDMVRPYVKEMGINYPILLAEADGMQVLSDYGGRGLPYSVFLSRDQQISSKKLGMFTKQELEQLITDLL